MPDAILVFGVPMLVATFFGGFFWGRAQGWKECEEAIEDRKETARRIGEAERFAISFGKSLEK